MLSFEILFKQLYKLQTLHQQYARIYAELAAYSEAAKKARVTMAAKDYWHYQNLIKALWISKEVN